VYTLSRREGVSEHGPEDVLHIRGMSADGLTGLSPVTQCRLALSLSSNLQEHAKQYFENGSRPSGVLSTPFGMSDEGRQRLMEGWRNEQSLSAGRMHSVAVVEGETKFVPIAFSADDSQFLQQRELSAREVARVFRVPAHLIDAATGDSLTYSNVTEQNRYFVTHSLRPWLVRIERAITNDTDLCPGSTYVQFDLDGLLRADARSRAEIFEKALDPITGWMRREEVRELEELPPEGGNE
jgi:HK97 family phage portal protein